MEAPPPSHPGLRGVSSARSRAAQSARPCRHEVEGEAYKDMQAVVRFLNNTPQTYYSTIASVLPCPPRSSLPAPPVRRRPNRCPQVRFTGFSSFGSRTPPWSSRGPYSHPLLTPILSLYPIASSTIRLSRCRILFRFRTGRPARGQRRRVAPLHEARRGRNPVEKRPGKLQQGGGE